MRNLILASVLATGGVAHATGVALHVAGVVMASLRHRENLVRAMVTGRKAPPRPGDVFE